MMIQKKIKIIDIKSIDYDINDYTNIDGLQYAEVEISRDRSSFAGIGFIVNTDNNTFTYKEIDEKVIKQVGKYDNLRIGMEEYYIKKIKDIFLLEEKGYGIEIVFLIYSDVRTSEMIFAQLVKEIDCHIIENN